jgi:hypothetical protein
MSPVVEEGVVRQNSIIISSSCFPVDVDSMDVRLFDKLAFTAMCPLLSMEGRQNLYDLF